MTSSTINDAVTIAGNGEGTLLANRYRVVRQLGQGGMGSVWLAEDTQLDDKPFAVKMLPSILVSNKRAYRQLKDEALVAMKLTHPNIVTLRAFEENNGNPFLVMDYIDGQTLDDYLAEHGGEVLTQRHRDTEAQSGRARSPSGPPGGLPESDVLRILRPVAAALDYAHGEGVVHRDVKPANVMIRKDGHPFILDFGIAREIQETMTRVTGKLSSGTLLYMSPEQLMGEQPRPAQDIYSFAAMAYECMKGEPPFSHGQIEFQIMNKRPEVLPGGPRPVAAAIMSGLAKKPEDRPHTCAAVLEGKDLTQRRGEAESQSGGARRPAEPVGSHVPRDRIVAPPQEPHGATAYTQADCVRLMVDAKVVQRHIARYSEDPDFLNDFQEIADDLVRAEVTAAERQWSLAAECYVRIVQRGTAIKDTVARREAEAKEKARREAEERSRREAAEKVRRTASPKTGDVKVVVLPGGAKMEMIYVAPGSFMMGSRLYGETQHRVTLTKGYWLGKYEVTQRQWESVMGVNPSRFKGPDRPVESVSWEDCQRFIAKVDAEARKQFGGWARLPTEAEWEYACRAGTTGAYGGNGQLPDMGWYLANSRGETHPVGQKLANAWGFHDMHGNVWEWSQDWYGAYKENVNDPQGPASGDGRVLRGGSWFHDMTDCRSANRYWFNPGFRDDFFGFRLCCSAGPREGGAEQ